MTITRSNMPKELVPGQHTITGLDAAKKRKPKRKTKKKGRK